MLILPDRPARALRRRWYKSPLTALIASVALGACGGCGSDDASFSSTNSGSPPGEILVIPEVVHVVPGETFRLEAQILSGEGTSTVSVGTAAPNAPDINWIVPDGLTPVAQADYWATFKVEPANQSAGPFKVKVKVVPDLIPPGLGEVIVSINTNQSTPASDALAGLAPAAWTADLGSPDLTPEFALVDGRTAAGWCTNDRVVAFVGWAWLGNLTADCPDLSSFSPYPDNEPVVGSVTFFSRDAAVQRIEVAWKDGQEIVTRDGVNTLPNFQGGFQQAPALAEVPIVAWQGVVTDASDGSDASISEIYFDDLVATDIALANEVLRLNRAGIWLNVVRTVRLGEDYWLFSDDPQATVVYNPDSSLGGTLAMQTCEHLTTEGKLDARDMSATDTLHMVFLRDAGNYHGYSCLKAPVILFGFWKMLPLTITHEVGHQMGLRDPDGAGPDEIGHTVDRAEILRNNVMWYPPYDSDAPRDRFTLGQVFRMSLDDSRSWLVKNGRSASQTTITCGPLYENDVPCPKLYRSVSDAGADGLYPLGGAP